jgi:serine protease AprX
VTVLSESFVEDLLLAGRAGRRLINESPVPFSVWKHFAVDLYRPAELLLTPMETTPAPKLAQFVFRRLPERQRIRPRITPLEGAVALTLDFNDFVDVALPATGLDLRASWEELHSLLVLEMDRLGVGGDEQGDAQPSLTLDDLFRFAALLIEQAPERRMGGFDLPVRAEGLDFVPGQRARLELSPELRTTLLVVLLLTIDASPLRFGEEGPADVRWRAGTLEPAVVAQSAVFLKDRLRDELLPRDPGEAAMVWRISLNRRVEPQSLSTNTIKADAARLLFNIDCRMLTWAVIDSGIDGSHPAFRDHEAGGVAIRVDKAYDFSTLRDLAAYDTLLDRAEMTRAVAAIARRLMITKPAARAMLNRLRADAEAGRPFDWDALSALLQVAPDRLDADNDGHANSHGTHVAGVLAGDWREENTTIFLGVCPNIRLYDLRVLGRGPEETEFAVIAALEFVRWLNARNRYISIHGVNLSIGLEHDKHNYACGRTPVCLACETTVASGVVVVAAAGNWGSQSYATAAGLYEGYAAMSIADPGNAASVITVGSTHRERPHEYGVSFFSSRGPTGDGRLKPDVVAPGERIDGPLPNIGIGRLDGTSMAAPHVSGVAALLMARHLELIGNPQRLKCIIVETATDLGRHRDFQGSGLVDALRALQSV